MPTQSIDMANVTAASFNGSTVEQINLNGTGIWPPPVGVDVSTAFVNIGEFRVDDGAYTDTTSNYSVSEIQVAASGSKRLYVAHKSTAPTTWGGDAPIACIQVLNSAGTSVLHQYYFGNSGNPMGWTTTPDGYSAGSTGVSITPASASSYSYSNITDNASPDTFGLATSTGSSLTGAADGIASPTGPMLLGNATIPQSGGTYYAYREASGSGSNEACFMRGPVISWTSGMRVRIAYIIGNAIADTHKQEVDDTLFIGIS